MFGFVIHRNKLHLPLSPFSASLRKCHFFYRLTIRLYYFYGAISALVLIIYSISSSQRAALCCSVGRCGKHPWISSWRTESGSSKGLTCNTHTQKVRVVLSYSRWDHSLLHFYMHIQTWKERTFPLHPLKCAVCSVFTRDKIDKNQVTQLNKEDLCSKALGR